MSRIPQAECTVVILARQYDALVQQSNAADARGDDTAHEAATSAMLEIADVAGHLTPTAQAGAAFQIMLASAQIDCVMNGTTHETMIAAAVRLERLLYRAMDVIGAGDSFENARDYLMPDRCDPRYLALRRCAA